MAAPQAHTGGMVALIPRDADAMVVSGGEDAENMHLTLTYLGDDVTGWDAAERTRVMVAAGMAAQQLAPVNARIMAHALFNPDGHEGRDPCAVYLVSDSAVLGPLRGALTPFAAADQHEPYIPHVTAGYGIPVTRLSYTGPIVFDRLRVALADQVFDFPLGDGEEIKRIMEDYEVKRTFTAEQRRKAHTMDDGSYPIENLGDLENAMRAYGRAKPSKRPAVKAHIRAQAKRLGLTSKLWDAFKEEKGGMPEHLKKKLNKTGGRPSDDKGGTADAGINNIGDLAKAIKTYKSAKAEDKPELWDKIKKAAGKLKATNMLANVDAPSEKSLYDDAWYEYKVASPHPGAVKLRRYWAHGKGRAKWRPGTPGDFMRLVRQLRKYVKNPRILKGLAANIHHMATGVWPGPGAHKDVLDWIEEGAPLETKGHGAEVDADDLFEQYKAVRQQLTDAMGDEEDEDEAGELDDGEPNAGVDELTQEDAYEQALTDDVDWRLEPDGMLARDDHESDLDSPGTLDESSTDEEDDGDLDELVDIFSISKSGASPASR